MNSSTASDAPLKGIACMVFGTVLLTSNDAITKWLLTSLHPGDVMAWRGLLSLPFVLLILQLEGGSLSSLRSKAPKRNFLRAVLALVTSAFVILSFQALPLADALAVIFVSPVMTTALSALVLKENVGWRRWLATMAGFVGAMIIVGPSFEEVGWAVLAPLAAAFFAALRDISTRSLSRIDNGPSILFWSMFVGMVGGFMSLPIMGASPVSNEGWLLFVGASAMLATSNRLIIAAFKFASGAIVAPLKYLALIWAAALGYLIWGDIPSLQTALGAVIVAMAGLYIWRREVILERELQK